MPSDAHVALTVKAPENTSLIQILTTTKKQQQKKSTHHELDEIFVL